MIIIAIIALYLTKPWKTW